MTTPIVSALKNYYTDIWSFLEVPAGFFYHFWDQVVKTVRRFQKRNGCYVTVSELKRSQIYNGRI
jgi:hypothetical protein